MDRFKGILTSINWTKVEKLDKGWSRDEKYYIEDTEGKRYVLRLSNIKKLEAKKRDFEMLKKIAKLKLNTPQPIEFGILEDKVYMLLTWIEGESAEDIIPTLSEKEQYKLGIKAGKILKKIHETVVEEQENSWEELFSPKIDRNLNKYRECGIELEGADNIIDYINDRRALLKGRAQVFHHGDYHIGNFLITSTGELGIIDFDRADVGDPWEEFNRITWCADTSPYFASGRIDGYFDNDVPDEFFKLLALYIGSNVLGSIPWAIPYGQKDIDTMLDQGKKIIESYNNFDSYIPKWYVTNIEVKNENL